MTTITISDNTGATYSGTEQLQIWGINPDENRQFLGFTINGYNNLPDVRSCLFRASLASIPVGKTFTEIRIKLWQEYIFNHGGGDIQNMVLLWCYRNWVLSEATWNSFSTGNSWASPGAGFNSADSDISNPASFPQSISNDGSYVTFTLNSAMLANAQAAYESLGSLNLLFQMPIYHTGEETQFTRNNGTDGNRPVVEVDYVDGGGISIPGAMNHLRNQGIS